MDDFSIITVDAAGIFDRYSMLDDASHTIPSTSALSAHARAAASAHITSAPVNEDRIEGYNSYCVIA